MTAGHHFLTHALPFDRSRSRMALDTFVAAIRRLSPLPADLEVVMLRCLVVLGRHTKTRIPSPIDFYLSGLPELPDPVDRFANCVGQLLRFCDIYDGSVQDALAYVDKCHCNASCSAPNVAASVGVRLSTLDVAFKRETGYTLTDCIREMRLQSAGVLLSTTGLSIKEVWVQVGYNHHSNFDHDFKRYFGVTPRAFRKQTIRPLAQRTFWARRQADRDVEQNENGRARVLIVDDDEGTRFTLDTWLRANGYLTAMSPTGEGCLLLVERFAPDVVLIDYHLADIDGVECLRALRSSPAGATAGVAIFTADLDVVERSNDIAALHAIVASKLCDLERVSDLIVYLLSPNRQVGGGRFVTTSWQEWAPFL
jgi:AraC-like DNA-binding protein/CheY-like chemotaxis protein